MSSLNVRDEKKVLNLCRRRSRGRLTHTNRLFALDNEKEEKEILGILGWVVENIHLHMREHIKN